MTLFSLDMYRGTSAVMAALYEKKRIKTPVRANLGDVKTDDPMMHMAVSQLGFLRSSGTKPRVAGKAKTESSPPCITSS